MGLAAPSTDLGEIKRAYAKTLRKTRPDDDAQAYQLCARRMTGSSGMRGGISSPWSAPKLKRRPRPPPWSTWPTRPTP